MLNEEQIARINLNDTSGIDRGSVNDPCYLVTPSFNLETSLQSPLTFLESNISSFTRMPWGQNQTNSSAKLGSPNETTFIGFERQQSGRNRLRGVSSRKEVCKQLQFCANQCRLYAIFQVFLHNSCLNQKLLFQMQLCYKFCF